MVYLIMAKNKRNYYLLYKNIYALKCVEGRYKDMYVDDSDYMAIGKYQGKGYSHIYDINYARPYPRYLALREIKSYEKNMGLKVEMVEIKIEENKWKDWKWQRWYKLWVKIKSLNQN